MSTVSPFDDSSAPALVSNRARARRNEQPIGDPLSRAQAELALQGSELRRLRAALREENRRREAAEAALIEARQQHDAALARASRLGAAGEMAGALAHQLGQPLAATLNYLHGCRLRLQRDDVELDSIRAALGEAIQHTEQAGGIVRHVRSFVARHEPEARATDLPALIRQTLLLVDGDCRRFGIDVQLDLAADAQAVFADALEIQQVLLNLLRNAIDAMAANTADSRRLRIASRVTADASRIAISVADSGPGIADADLPRIFESWFTTKRDGLGLGLAVCRTIVESHGGSLNVQRGDAGGAVFQFDLSRVARA